MRKTITINGTEYKFKSSAAIPRIYRLKFGRDIFVDMQKIEKQIKIQEKLKDEMQKKCEKEVFCSLPEQAAFSSLLCFSLSHLFPGLIYKKSTYHF